MWKAELQIRVEIDRIRIHPRKEKKIRIRPSRKKTGSRSDLIQLRQPHFFLSQDLEIKFLLKSKRNGNSNLALVSEHFKRSIPTII